MKRAGRARREALVALVPEGRIVVDVGADHGHVAHALGAVATERRPHRSGRADVPWVIADGLAPFAEVDVAVIAGMGAHTIAAMLSRGPRPAVLVAHAPDDPPALRTWLAGHGWRIDAERLAPEGSRWAEVLRAVPGDEPSSGLRLAFGPRLLEGDDPYLQPHLLHHARYHADLALRTRGRPEGQTAQARADFLREQLEVRGWGTPPTTPGPAEAS